LDARAVAAIKGGHNDPPKSIHNYCLGTLKLVKTTQIQVFPVTAICNATSYTNSAVNIQMNACMTFQSFPILFGLYLFIILPKVFWRWLWKVRNASVKDTLKGSSNCVLYANEFHRENKGISIALLPSTRFYQNLVISNECLMETVKFD